MIAMIKQWNGVPHFQPTQKKERLCGMRLVLYCFFFTLFSGMVTCPSLGGSLYFGCLVALVISGCPSNHRQSQWQGMDAEGGPHFMW
jgi:hypothetical protein